MLQMKFASFVISTGVSSKNAFDNPFSLMRFRLAAIVTRRRRAVYRHASCLTRRVSRVVSRAAALTPANDVFPCEIFYMYIGIYFV